MKKFYVCEHCGNVIEKHVDSKVPVMCCGSKMTELVANTVEASVEKHIPVVNVNGNKVSVSVGSVNHPMTAEHLIQCIYLETNLGGAVKYLAPEAAPEVEFALAEGEKAVSVYAYCNLHGLWKADI